MMARESGVTGPMLQSVVENLEILAAGLSLCHVCICNKYILYNIPGIL